ncbi:phage portal protein [Streptococcus iniae]|uniref:phage portal protein n=1 Tax=Streptococcus iniae TaxID=1346 RepID=UPI00033480E1|nr:phage portal protein [Streptococcus iniae]AGM99843.1 phage portal protein, HK97 family [Streptococcus iniae SF1]QBX16809.1 portal (connector) protein [Streptococcus phage Javan275]QBX25779.1 portal (connector) protein [Streptococcus phage Javan272]ASL35736.1 phage portal protein, HK97 family [Streptococcus iniae]ELY5748936.1 phage portal protein [Streptococcus iniae]
MGFLDKLLRRNKQQSVVNMLSHSNFGVIFDGDNYIPLARNPDVIMAVNKVADMVSNMTIHLMENTDKGAIRVKDGLARKIDVNPCEHMTRKTWIFKIVRDLLLYGDGNSVLHVEYDPVTDYILNLRPFPMGEVSFKTNDKTYLISYKGIDYEPDEVVHFAINPDPDTPFIGTGFRLALQDIVRNLNMATQTKKGFMSGKNVPSLIVKVDSSDAELATMEGRDKIAKKYLETSQAGAPWIVPDALIDVQQVKPLSLNDIALNESVEIDKKTVAGLLGVPAFVLGVGNFNKVEYNNFVNTTIMSIAITITQTLTRDLLVSSNRYFKFNPRSLYSYDITELSSVAKQMTDSAAMRRNEWRDWVGMTPDPEMDEIIVLENYLPQGELGNQSKLIKEGGKTDEET